MDKTQGTAPVPCASDVQRSNLPTVHAGKAAAVPPIAGG